jgi:transaldolase/glucose-6-phosphate isomerase
LLEGLQGKGGMPSATPRISEAGIELYAEGPTRHEISTLSLADALQTFFEACRDEDYLALLAFLPSNSNMGAKLHSLRKHMARGLGITVRVSFGPRYLSSLGQLYKGGPAIGRFLMLTAAHAEDIPIPGAGYTFGQFQMAQALGDLAALGKHEKPVLRLHFLEGAEQGLAQLERVVERALAHVRRARR